MASQPASTTALRFPTREECVVPDLLAARADATPDKPFLLFEDEQWTYAQAAREAWRAANGLHARSASRWATTSRSGCRRVPTCSARGSARTPPAPSTRRSTSRRAAAYLEHTLNLAEVEGARRAPPARRAARSASTLPSLETVVARRRRSRRSSCRGGPSRSRRCSTARRRAAGAAATGRAVGRPQPHLHVRHDRARRRASAPRTRRSGTTRTASSCRSSTTTTATSTRCRCSTRPAPASRTRCCAPADRSR